MTVRPAHTPDERSLEKLQKKVAEGEIARGRRDELAFQMWNDGMTQAEIAERLDRADRSAGGQGITASTTQKVLFRLRKKKEAQLLERLIRS